MIRLGKPTHLKVTGKEYPGVPAPVSWTACGLIGTTAQNAAYDPRHVDCRSCQRTNEYARRMKGDPA